MFSSAAVVVTGGERRQRLASRASTSSSSSASSAESSRQSAPTRLRWKSVIEAPDTNPRRGQQRPRRGRPRKHPPRNRDEDRKDEKLNIINWRPPMHSYPTPVYHQPPPGATVLPWACKWPEILQFYMSNSDKMDFISNNLYSHKRYKKTTGEFLSTFQFSPGTLTLRILFAEASRQDKRSPLNKLLWLKGQALGLVNEALNDPTRQLTAGTLSDIMTLHNYEQVYGTQQVAVMHRKGLLQLTEMMGGIKNLKGQAALLAPMILWADRSRQARRLWDPSEDPPEYPLDYEPGLQPLHPLNIALLPPDQIGSPQARGYALGISILGPGVRLMVALEALQRLCAGAAACMQMYDQPEIVAFGIKEKLRQVERGLLDMERDPNIEGEATFFTSPKYLSQQIMYEAARLAGLVIVRLIHSELLDRSFTARVALTTAITRMGTVNARPLLEHYPRILLWIIFVQGPWHPLPMRMTYAAMASRTLAKIGLDSWEATRATLARIYYYPEVQEAACKVFWKESLDAPAHGVWDEVEIKQEDQAQPRMTWGEYYGTST